MTSARGQLGRWGEAQARLRLEAQGYRLLATNFRCAAGEVDIIAQDGTELVFVEVKTRRGHGYGTPAEAVTAAKALRLEAVAHHYLQTQLAGPQASAADWRIDVIGVSLDRNGRLLAIDHLKNAVES